MATETTGPTWTFHPYEIALVGYQNSGKTTLAAKLVALLGLNLAYVKRNVSGNVCLRTAPSQCLAPFAYTKR